MNGRVKRGNTFIVIENGLIKSYSLDDKIVWEIGRPSKEGIPDIKLHSPTVSRNHGRLKNQDGVWFYVDNRGKNGSFYNHRQLSSGINGRVKPVMLMDGDSFVFGAGQEEHLNQKTVFGLYFTKDFEEDWRIVDSKGYREIKFTSGQGETSLYNPQKGTVINQADGIGIYMGDLTYLIGDMEMTGNA